MLRLATAMPMDEKTVSQAPARPSARGSRSVGVNLLRVSDAPDDRPNHHGLQDSWEVPPRDGAADSSAPSKRPLVSWAAFLCRFAGMLSFPNFLGNLFLADGGWLPQ